MTLLLPSGVLPKILGKIRSVAVSCKTRCCFATYTFSQPSVLHVAIRVLPSTQRYSKWYRLFYSKLFALAPWSAPGFLVELVLLTAFNFLLLLSLDQTLLCAALKTTRELICT